MSIETLPADVRPDDYRRVMEALQGWLAPSSVPKWLQGSNGHLAGRHPISVLRKGDVEAVLAAVEAEKAGAFT